ncbi:MAG: glycosyltransferase family 1 protein [Parcubacteria group bacterium]|jgi:glycosyltransferase involved in cell wall biosynthesis
MTKVIGIDASRAFQKNRTGIEEYSYQTIKNLMNKLEGHRVVLYIRKNQQIDFKLPEDWRTKVIRWPYLWTQIGLSLELLFHPADVLFIPAHTIPFIHPDNTVVTIHGLEYEFCPKAYSFWERIYMRCVIKNSCRWAKTIIAVSNNTRNDLIKLYKVLPEKIKVIYEGYDSNFQFSIFNFQSNSNDQIFNDKKNTRYLLFIGRLEERKNVVGIVEAFEILKEKYHISHKLILAGGKGYGFKKIKSEIQDTKYKSDIILKGFVRNEEKYELIRNADVFLFPSFYEGFGLPILEAQSVGTPVVTSNISSMPEIVCHSERLAKNPRVSNKSFFCNHSGSFAEAAQDDKCSAILVDPNSPQEIAEATYELISEEKLKNDIINKGLENVKRFSWEKCGEEIADLILC